MVGRVVVQAADDGHLVEQAGVFGEQFAELDAGDGGVDGVELASDFLGGVGLGVIGINMGGTAEEEDLDDGGVSGGAALRGPGSQDIGHREPGHAEGADPQEATAGHAVAGPSARRTEDVEHGRDPFGPGNQGEGRYGQEARSMVRRNKVSCEVQDDGVLLLRSQLGQSRSRSRDLRKKGTGTRPMKLFPGNRGQGVGPGASPHFPPACAIQPFGAPWKGAID